MSSPIYYLERATGKKKMETVYGKKFLDYLYGDSLFSSSLASLLSKVSFFSKFYGFTQRLSLSRYAILPFIKEYGIDATEFLEPIENFRSFDDFFTRKLKPEARPLSKSPAIFPTDARYLFYPAIHTSEGFIVKNKRFCLSKLLDDESLASHYHQGSMLMARLCPSDYHRFHFPCSCIPGPSRLINGPLYSVNPIAVKKNIDLLTENKRMITELNTDQFGKVLFIEIGATNVGSIHQTFVPNRHYKKGDEKGFFSFGGSALILLFEQNRISFDSDLLELSTQNIEILCLMGQSLGIAI